MGGGRGEGWGSGSGLAVVLGQPAAELSLVKHAALVEQAWIGFIADGDSPVFLPDDDWTDGFRLVAGNTTLTRTLHKKCR
jgi:hypothetical protein